MTAPLTREPSLSASAATCATSPPAIATWAATPAVRPVAAAMADRDPVAARVGIRWVLDPDDDVASVRALTAAHDLEAGRIVCHTVPGASWSVMVRDLLCALGKDRDALSRDRRVRDGPALLQAWLRAEDVGHVVVLRAHTVAPAVLEALAGLAVATDTIIWLVWHAREQPPPMACAAGRPVSWVWAAAMLRPCEPRAATSADHAVCEVYGRTRARARLDARAWAIRVPWVEPRYVAPGCPLSVVLQRLTIDATSHDELLTRLHAAQTGFRDEGLSLDLPGLSDHDHIAALGPRLDSATLARLRRFACPTTAAALMLALATDANSRQLAMTSAFWTCRAYVLAYRHPSARPTRPSCSPRPNSAAGRTWPPAVRSLDMVVGPPRPGGRSGLPSPETSSPAGREERRLDKAGSPGGQTSAKFPAASSLAMTAQGTAARATRPLDRSRMGPGSPWPTSTPTCTATALSTRDPDTLARSSTTRRVRPRGRGRERRHDGEHEAARRSRSAARLWIPLVLAAPFQALCKRYERAWGEPLRGPWKKEFQGRGAPHFHISTTPPMGTTTVPDPATGQPIRVDFKRWLSITWADIVAHPDEEQRRRHLAAGTGVDYAQGIKLTDPRRMAVYFAKYGAAATGKEYQHQVPCEWLTTVLVCTACGAGYDEDLDECPDCSCPDADVTEEGSVGRFWGYRSLHRELAIRQVTPDVGIAAGRIARRWYRAKGLTKTVTVQRVVQATGLVTYRRSTVRKRLFAHGRGFLCVNDGAEFASQLARYLAVMPKATPQSSEMVAVGSLRAAVDQN